MKTHVFPRKMSMFLNASLNKRGTTSKTHEKNMKNMKKNIEKWKNSMSVFWGAASSQNTHIPEEKALLYDAGPRKIHANNNQKTSTKHEKRAVFKGVGFSPNHSYSWGNTTRASPGSGKPSQKHEKHSKYHSTIMKNI